MMEKMNEQHNPKVDVASKGKEGPDRSQQQHERKSSHEQSFLEPTDEDDDVAQTKNDRMAQADDKATNDLSKQVPATSSNNSQGQVDPKDASKQQILALLDLPDEEVDVDSVVLPKRTSASHDTNHDTVVALALVPLQANTNIYSAVGLPGAYAVAPGVTPERQQRASSQELEASSITTSQHHQHHHHPPHDSTTTNPLAEATPVPDQEALDTAHELDASEQRHAQERRKLRQQKQRQQTVRMAVLAVLLVLVVVVGVVVGSLAASAAQPQPQQEPQAKDDTAAVVVVDSNTTNTTTTNNTTTIMLQDLLSQLPPETQERIARVASPQYQAWDWLSRHRNLTQLPTWRQTQLYALATFFYSFQGAQWPTMVQERWLDDTKDECYWFSGEYGRFDEDTGEYIPVESFGVPPCNDQGRFQSIKLGNLNLGNHPPTTDNDNNHDNHADLPLIRPVIPPEIALLTSLSIIGLGYNDIYGPLDNLLIPELALLPNLTLFNCRTNHITGTIPTTIAHMLHSVQDLILYTNPLSGTIPSELGLMTALTSLDISESNVTGDLPSQIGQLTHLQALYISANPLWNGTMPTELGRLTQLQDLYFEYNDNMHGTIPSEIGLLHATLQGFSILNTSITGSIPSQLGRLTNVVNLHLAGNWLQGPIPTSLCPWDCKERTSPFPQESFLGRHSQVHSRQVCDDECVVGEYFPKNTHELMIAVQFDGWPDETSFALQVYNVSQQAWSSILDVQGTVPLDEWELVSFPIYPLMNNTLYHFYIQDKWADGFYGGALSITNATTPDSVIGTAYEGYKGTILWSTQQVGFQDYSEAFLWVDSNGLTSVVASREEGMNLTMAAASVGGGVRRR